MSEKITEEISTKNTKNEILEAYKQLLRETKDSKRENRKEESEIKKQKEVVHAAKELSPDMVIKDLAALRLQVVKFFETICEQIIDEHKKLKDIQQAIGIEENHLRDVYEIQVGTDTLAALLLGQKQKKADFEQELAQEREWFEQEIAEKKEKWEKEKALFEMNQKEQKEKLMKIRQQEEEEYRYRLELERRKDQDQYHLKKEALERELVEKRSSVEKELSDRTTALTNQEQELIQLRKQVDTFPGTLKKAIAEAEQKAIEQLHSDYKFATELKEKEIEGERKLNKQIVENYMSKIKEMESQIARLTQKADQAIVQIQDIAVKAIEGASGSVKRFNHDDHEKFVKQGEK